MNAAPADALTVTLLGTGTPQLRPDRFGPATLVEAGGLTLLFDAGRGCTIRLAQLGIPLGKLDGLFVTHFHSDHLNGLPDLWMTGYIGSPYGARKVPLEVYGPDGTAQICTGLVVAFADDVRIRSADEHVSAASATLAGHDFPEAGGVVLEKDGVRVTAFPVDHGALIRPAVGFRIDWNGRSAVISGDTRFDERVIARATGSDVLVHEVCAAPERLAKDPHAIRVTAHHTSPEEAGEVFRRARPRLAVYTHLVQLSRPHAPPVTEGEIVRRTRAVYDGPLVMGEDLTRIAATAGGVAVYRWDHAAKGYGAEQPPPYGEDKRV